MNICRYCKKEMKFNVPRLGASAGFVHAETGLLGCHENPWNAPPEGSTTEYMTGSPQPARNKKVAIHLLSAQIVHRVKDSGDSVMNLCQVVENLIRGGEFVKTFGVRFSGHGSAFMPENPLCNLTLEEANKQAEEWILRADTIGGAAEIIALPENLIREANL